MTALSTIADKKEVTVKQGFDIKREQLEWLPKELLLTLLIDSLKYLYEHLHEEKNIPSDTEESPREEKGSLSLVSNLNTLSKE